MKAALIAVALMLPGIAWAEGKPSGARDYCPARPGLGTPACTMAPGRVSVETSLADWTLDKQGSDRTDTVLIGNSLIRIGLTDTIEAQIGWTPLGLVRDRSGGTVSRATRTGDVTLGLKANLANADGSGLSVAVQPFVTLPVGRTPVGAGDWSSGIAVPVTYDLSKTVNLEFTPEIDAAVDQDGHGRHFAMSGVFGIGVAASDKLTITLEDEVIRDDDPAGKSTQDLVSLSLAFMARDNLQFDVGAVAGFDRTSPDAEVYIGIARRF